MSGPAWESPDFLWGTRRPPAAAAHADAVVAAGPRPPTPGVPGEVGLWVFVLGDMTIFGAFFAVLMAENRGDRELFAASSAQLLPAAGALNTLVLLLASYLVVVALRAHRLGRGRAASWALAGAGACAAAFVAVKAVEWRHALAGGHGPGENDFYTLYFVLTGVHLLHVLIGSVLLLAWWRRCRSGAPFPAGRAVAESSAVYWHMVDLLWIGIFTLAYLVPGA